MNIHFFSVKKSLKRRAWSIFEKSSSKFGVGSSELMRPGSQEAGMTEVGGQRSEVSEWILDSGCWVLVARKLGSCEARMLEAGY